MTTKLAIVRQKYRPDGGAERFISRALENLSQRDLQVSVITRQWADGGDYNILTCNPAKWGRISREKRFATAACKLISRHDFDIVQSHERIACCDIFRAGDGVHREWLEQRKRILSPLQIKWLELSPYHKYVCEAERRMFASPRLKAVICNSEMVKQEIQDHFGLPGDKLHIIYNGINTRVFHPGLREQHRESSRKRLGIPDEVPVAIFVGSGFERKGLAGALEALALGSDITQLVVVGSDKQEKKYQQIAERLGLASRVHWLGVQQDVKPWYAAADFLLLPTLYDPFPNVIFEAMACALPIITSTKCGGAELVTEGCNGFVCDALDFVGLGHAINKLTPLETCQTLGQTSRHTVLNYEQSDMIDRLIQLYSGLIRTEPRNQANS